jgi:hypothetical protein
MLQTVIVAPPSTVVEPSFALSILPRFVPTTLNHVFGARGTCKKDAAFTTEEIVGTLAAAIPVPLRLAVVVTPEAVSDKLSRCKKITVAIKTFLP